MYKQRLMTDFHGYFRDSVDLWLRIGFGALILLGCYLRDANLHGHFVGGHSGCRQLAVVRAGAHELRQSFDDSGDIHGVRRDRHGAHSVVDHYGRSRASDSAADSLGTRLGGRRYEIARLANCHSLRRRKSINEAFHLGFDPAALGDFIQKAIDPAAQVGAECARRHRQRLVPDGARCLYCILLSRRQFPLRAAVVCS